MNVNSNKLDSGISWVCSDCGKKALSLPINKGKKQFEVSTFHTGHCDVCNGDKCMVTEARDFMFPVFEVADNWRAKR